MSTEMTTNQDSAELEALFDSIAQQRQETLAHVQPAPAPAAPSSAAPATAKKAARRKKGNAADNSEVINQVGQLTRNLHENLRALGYDKHLASAATSIPDARDRLAYVVALTQQAAERVLNATEIAKPLQEGLEQGAASLTQRWDELLAGKSDIEGFKQLVQDTRGFLKETSSHAQQTDAQLLEIMMAQDFQDLTGQILKRVTTLVQEVETQLLQLLLDHTPNAVAAPGSGGLEGPVINTHSHSDVVTSQAQVDDLLASMGF